jgi:hypothetical protein
MSGNEDRIIIRAVSKRNGVTTTLIGSGLLALAFLVITLLPSILFYPVCLLPVQVLLD